MNDASAFDISVRPASADDDAFAYDVKKQALGPYIAQVWGWDEDVQRDFHRREFDFSRLRIVSVSGMDVGTMAVGKHEDHLAVYQLYILPEHQNRGIGTRLIRNLQERAREGGLPVRLQVLKVNRAIGLYARLGFRPTGETDTHVLMEWN